MIDVIWSMIVGPLMWIPILNIGVGLIAVGWPGAIVGLVVTLLMSGGSASNETVRRTVKRKAREWWDVLGVAPGASRDEIVRAHRNKAKAAHPDLGGDPAAMTEINRARDQALKGK